MQHAWEYVIAAARNLHRQGSTYVTRAQLMQEVQRLGWPHEMVTIGTHISDHMRADRDTATHPLLGSVGQVSEAVPANKLQDGRMSIPQPQMIDQMWRDLQLTHIADQPQAVDELLRTLETTRINGGALFAWFQYENHPVLDYFIEHRHLTGPPLDLPSGFLAHPEVRRVLPVLELPAAGEPSLTGTVVDVFDLEASLARAVFSGGAYRSFEGSLRQAKSIAGQAVDALQGDLRYHWFHHSVQDWSPWFSGGPWDGTWIGLDSFKKRLWLLCVTDTD